MVRSLSYLEKVCYYQAKINTLEDRGKTNITIFLKLLVRLLGLLPSIM